jgi:hypothetical protein
VKELIAVAVGGTIVMNILIAGYATICAWFISVLFQAEQACIYVG